ncbi:hypothetical protein OHA79_09545 [Streptomyces sp. NBC_00841]|uniref:deoxynucleotide monophosphate kinase family protein n=1 Tax=Streptomyces sp. NBC_00841 TaxID=2975847 RepID=UPI002DD7F989|nr:hypothetical protein [Streptomyces sp. NBC_00841]WRZ98058.1 hypothetical protein OHA79_09545 [Streptomyces sp. NBC_00841]
MTFPNIALIGKARAGKDTVAAHLIAQHQYTRVAFADPLKEMALAVDPIVVTDDDDLGVPGDRLSDVVNFWGWERAKDSLPEVRRILQHLGGAVREQDENFWLDQALNKFWAARRWNLPVVVTDCRYKNEAEALRREGFMLVRITRPGTDPGNHASETELDCLQCDRVIHNVGTLKELRDDTEWLLP